ncbi:MAG: hypothetical protein CL398_07385 [Acidiferrobacteraceae bacterium]|nr:hypothetical protein [Acidiferrobacteraceae bacterium]|tara:strand:- start:632 stop:913 length:282 start_codon:yes stop_codon:yes gene_type:complete
MYEAFLEAPWKARLAAICFVLAKLMFVATAVAMLISNTATIIALSIYSSLILASIVLCLVEGFSKRKKTYKELEEEVELLRVALGGCGMEKKS